MYIYFDGSATRTTAFSINGNYPITSLDIRQRTMNKMEAYPCYFAYNDPYQGEVWQYTSSAVKALKEGDFYCFSNLTGQEKNGIYHLNAGDYITNLIKRDGSQGNPAYSSVIIAM